MHQVQARPEEVAFALRCPLITLLQEAAERAKLPMAAGAVMMLSGTPGAGYEATGMFVVRFSLAF